MAARFLSEVYTVDEVARAAHVPTHAAEQLLAGQSIPLTNGFLQPTAALTLGRQLRAAAIAEPVVDSPLFSEVPDTTDFARRQSRLPAILSSSVHIVVVPCCYGQLPAQVPVPGRRRRLNRRGWSSC